MITCPTCGAGNRPGATVCRMCALRLEGAVPDQRPKNAGESVDSSRQVSTLIFPNLQTRPGTVEIGDEITCPDCKAINEAGWLFCHSCGRRLAETAPEIQIPEIVSAQDENTGDEQEAAAPQIQPEMENQEIAQPERRRVTEPTRRMGEPANTPVAGGNTQLRQAERPRDESASTPVAINALYCPQCGSLESGNDPLCSRCGSPMAVNQTVVMSSVVPTSQGRLRHILDGGQSGEVYNLQGDTVIGRTQGDISFAFDELMSSKHGRIVRRGDDFFYIDEDSRNGTFIKIKKELRLEPGDVLLIGKQLFRFEA